MNLQIENKKETIWLQLSCSHHADAFFQDTPHAHVVPGEHGNWKRWSVGKQVKGRNYKRELVYMLASISVKIEYNLLAIHEKFCFFATDS